MTAALALTALATLASAASAQPPRSLPAPLADFFLAANSSYHNVGTLGPASRAAVAAVGDENAWLEADPDDLYFEFADNAISRMEAVRAKAAAFLNVGLDETALVESTTFALSTVATGLVEGAWLGAADRVLMTDQEHAGATSGWLHYAALGAIAGVDAVHVPVAWPAAATAAAADPVADLVAAFAAALANASASYKVLAVPHVLTTTGVALPLPQLAALAHSHGVLLVVDGAQAPGGLAVDVSATGADVYATSAHKHMLAPKAAALLVVRKAAQAHVRATFLDGGFASYTGQTGTRSAANVAGLGAAIDYLNSFGMPAVQAHNLALRNAFAAAVAALAIPGLVGASPSPDASYSQLWSSLYTVALPPGVTSPAVGAALKSEYAIVVKMTGAAVFPAEWPAGSPAYALRFSFHVFNDADEVARVANALGAVVQRAVAAAAAAAQRP